MSTCYLLRFVYCYYLFTSTNSYYFRYPIIVPGLVLIILLIFIVVFMSTYLNFNFINFTQPVSNLSSTYALRLILLINLPNDNLHSAFLTLFIIPTGHETLLNFIYQLQYMRPEVPQRTKIKPWSRVNWFLTCALMQ